MSTNGEAEEFAHKIAIELSRALNTLNPNNLLARRGKDLHFCIRS